MPIIRLALLILACCVFAPAAALALPEREYEILLEESADFRAADNELSEIWETLMRVLDGYDKAQMREDQRAWLRDTRDIKAGIYMAQGVPKAQAYAKVSRQRAQFLRNALENYQRMGRRAGQDQNAAAPPGPARNGVSPMPPGSARSAEFETEMALIWRDIPDLAKQLYVIGANEGMLALCMAEYENDEYKMNSCLKNVHDAFARASGRKDLVAFMDMAYGEHRYSGVPPAILISLWLNARINGASVNLEELRQLDGAYRKSRQTGQGIDSIDEALKNIRQ